MFSNKICFLVTSDVWTTKQFIFYKFSCSSDERDREEVWNEIAFILRQLTEREREREREREEEEEERINLRERESTKK